MHLTQEWFDSDSNWLEKITGVFIKGDRIVLWPFLLLNIGVAIYDYKAGFILFLLFNFLRYIVEMIYWIVKQEGDRTYRPYDFGLTNLNNNSIYIIYQIGSLSIATLSLFLLYFVFYCGELPKLISFFLSPSTESNNL